MMLKTVLKRWPLASAATFALLAAISAWDPGDMLEYFRKATALELFTLAMFMVFLLPPLFARLRLPSVVALLVGGVMLGPHVLGIIDPEDPALQLFGTVGRVFLMFIVGLEIDMRVFQATQRRSMGFGLATFLFPLLLGATAAKLFDFGWNAAVLIGSLLASHTLLGFPIISRLGLSKRESQAVAVGATIFTDITSLLVLAVCISVHKGGFSALGLLQQLFQLAIYSVLILQGLPLLGRLYFRRHRDDEHSLFTFIFLAVMLAAAGAHFIHLEDIVGAFLAGIAVNRVLSATPVRDKVIMMGETLFIPLFFMTIGIKLDLPIFFATLSNSLPFVVAIVAALLLGKLLAVVSIRGVYRYSWPELLTMWSLTLPQVAATLAAAIAAFDALNEDGDRLISESVLNAVIVLMVLTSILGPVLTGYFGHQLATTEETFDADS
jgi:Kef-type K+ transport system membrane component KefB